MLFLTIELSDLPFLGILNRDRSAFTALTVLSINPEFFSPKNICISFSPARGRVTVFPATKRAEKHSQTSKRSSQANLFFFACPFLPESKKQSKPRCAAKSIAQTAQRPLGPDVDNISRLHCRVCQRLAAAQAGSKGSAQNRRKRRPTSPHIRHFWIVSSMPFQELIYTAARDVKFRLNFVTMDLQYELPGQVESLLSYSSASAIATVGHLSPKNRYYQNLKGIVIDSNFKLIHELLIDEIIGTVLVTVTRY
eukprot:g43254.t1